MTSRVTIKKNGRPTGQVVVMPNSLEALVTLAGDVTQTNVSRLYNISGDTISTIDVIRDGDIIVAGGDEPFVAVGMGQSVCRNARDVVNRGIDNATVRQEVSNTFQPYGGGTGGRALAASNTIGNHPLRVASRSGAGRGKRKRELSYSKSILILRDNDRGEKVRLNVENTLLSGQISYSSDATAATITAKIKDLMTAGNLNPERPYRYAKCMNKTLTPHVCEERFQWDATALHSLAGQGKLYILLKPSPTPVQGHDSDLEDFVIETPRRNPQTRPLASCTITSPASVSDPNISAPLASPSIATTAPVRQETPRARHVPQESRWQGRSTITAPVSVRPSTTVPAPRTTCTITAPVLVEPATTVPAAVTSTVSTAAPVPTVRPVRPEPEQISSNQARFNSIFAALRPDNNAENDEFDDDDDDMNEPVLQNASSAVTSGEVPVAPGLQDILQTKIRELNREPGAPTLNISILRRCLYKHAVRRINAVQNHQFPLRLRVRFVQEAAVDEGGPSREFFRMFFMEATAKLLTTNGMLRIDGSRRADGEYRTFGILTVLALLNGCAGPRTFAPQEASLIVYGRTIIDPDEVENADLRNKMKEMMAINDVGTLQTFVEEQLEERFDVGFSKASTRIELSDRQPMLEQFLLAESNKRSAERTEYIEGLRTCDFLRTVRRYPQRCFEEFVRGQQELTALILENLIHLQYTTHGDQRITEGEEELAMNWVIFLHQVEDGHVTVNTLENDVVMVVTLGDILAFITGASDIPPIPFFPPPSLKFDHNTPNRAITASTCANELSCPVNEKTRDPDRFGSEMLLAMFGSYGFGHV